VGQFLFHSFFNNDFNVPKVLCRTLTQWFINVKKQTESTESTEEEIKREEAEEEEESGFPPSPAPPACLLFACLTEESSCLCCAVPGANQRNEEKAHYQAGRTSKPFRHAVNCVK